MVYASSSTPQSSAVYAGPQDMVAAGLCVRCGACASLCPSQAVRLDEDYYPRLLDHGNSCIHCGQCMKICPGADVPFPQLYKNLFESSCDPQDILGIVDHTCLSCSTDDTVRIQASSGGTVTQLLVSLLRDGSIKSAILAGSSPDSPWKGVSSICRTEEEIRACTQSKYTIIPQLEHLREVLDSKEPFALVGLPCQIHAFRKFQAEHPKAASNAKLVIGLFCHTNIENEGILQLLRCKGLSPEEVEQVDFRYGLWPGKVVARLRNGKTLLLHPDDQDFKDSVIKVLKLMYRSRRCLMCIDYTAEFSDISVGDPWIRNHRGNYAYPEGYSMTLIRTSRGKELFQRAIDSKEIRTVPITMEQCRSCCENIRKQKRVRAMIRLEARRKRNLPVPKYHDQPYKILFRDRFRESGAYLDRISTHFPWGRSTAFRLAFSRLGAFLIRVFLWAQRKRRTMS